MRRKDREVTELAEIQEILDGCKTCHIAMIDGASPYVVPMSYGYRLDGHTLTLYFHSAREGRKIDILRQNDRVCFAISREGEPVTAETPCASGYCFASVIGDGRAVFVEDGAEKNAALACVVKHQSGRDASFAAEQQRTVTVFKIVSESFTGKRKTKPVIASSQKSTTL